MSAAKELANSLQMNDHGPLHAQRVHSITKQLSSLFALTDHERSLLMASALLHDIGMAKNREEHHLVSYELVKELSDSNKLPFDQNETEIVATLCKWHRKNYDPANVCQMTGMRVGLLASILRLADGMDLDYRRSDKFETREDIVHKFYEPQERHHLSVLNILALRFNISNIDTRIELFMNLYDHASLQLGRLIDEMINTPISWPIQIIPVHERSYYHLVEKERNKNAIIFSYCNPHGAVSAAISKRQLENLGFNCTVVFGNEQTGYAPIFWSKYFLNWDFRNTDLVALLDLHIPKDQEQDVLQKVSENRHCHWICASVLATTNAEIEKFSSVGLNILIGDERALFAGNSIDRIIVDWMKVAGLCNFDDHLLSATSFGEEEYKISRGIRHSLWELMENKSNNNDYLYLIDRIVNDDKKYFIDREPLWKKLIENRLPDYKIYGRVLVLKRTEIAGRFIYDIAGRLIEKQGLVPYDNNEFSTPFAIYWRQSGRGIVVLYFSRFVNTGKAYPVKYFVPHCDKQVGNNSTIWQTYPDKEKAIEKINETINRINSHFNTKSEEVLLEL